MLIECRFCLEELEVNSPDECSLNDMSVDSDSDNSSVSPTPMVSMETSPDNNYIEFKPITKSKKKNKDIGNRLVRPCSCKGTQQHVHVKCLCQWIAKCNKWYCTICSRVYNLSPSQLHYCVVKLQRKGALKNLPPIYSHSDFSRSSYFALLVFMGTLSMLMLPSSIPNQKLLYTNAASVSSLSSSALSSFSSTSFSTYSCSYFTINYPNYFNFPNHLVMEYQQQQIQQESNSILKYQQYQQQQQQQQKQDHSYVEGLVSMASSSSSSSSSNSTTTSISTSIGNELKQKLLRMIGSIPMFNYFFNSQPTEQPNQTESPVVLSTQNKNNSDVGLPSPYGSENGDYLLLNKFKEYDSVNSNIYNENVPVMSINDSHYQYFKCNASTI